MAKKEKPLTWLMVVICVGEKFTDLDIPMNELLEDADDLVKRRVSVELPPDARWLMLLLHTKTGKFLIQEHGDKNALRETIAEMQDDKDGHAVASDKATKELDLFICEECRSREHSRHLH